MQRSASVSSLAERLASLSKAPKLDRFDDMAVDMIGYASALSFKEARELIAAQLRLLHVEGQIEGIREAKGVLA
jgi:hypothetical protein